MAAVSGVDWGGENPPGTSFALLGMAEGYNPHDPQKMRKILQNAANKEKGANNKVNESVGDREKELITEPFAIKKVGVFSLSLNPLNPLGCLIGRI